MFAAIDQLEHNVGMIEQAVDELELESRQMMLHLGLDKKPKPRLSF